MMKKFLLFIALLLLTACNNNQGANNNEFEILETRNTQANSNDEMLVKSRDNIDLENVRNNSENQLEAENLVREKLDNKENLIVQYDHREEDRYIIHVYSLNDAKENSEHWYMVDLSSNKVSLLRQ